MNNSFAQLVQSAKQDSVSMENVIAKMNPLLKKYSKKAFFLDKDDAYQELILALIEAVMRIDICKTDGECLIYLKMLFTINLYIYVEIMRKTTPTLIPMQHSPMISVLMWNLLYMT